VSRQTLKNLSSRNYAVTLEQLSKDEGSGYIARIPDLPGITGSYGDTPEEALTDLGSAKILYFKAALASNYEIPEPIERYSGQLEVKLPKSLHRDLATQARREGVNLNTLIVSRLSTPTNQQAK
jgi:antitoxin HicB